MLEPHNALSPHLVNNDVSFDPLEVCFPRSKRIVWTGEVDDSVNAFVTLHFPEDWVLAIKGRAYYENGGIQRSFDDFVLTRPGFKLRQEFPGFLDGANDWELSIEMGDWKFAKWNCYSCGCLESGEIVQTPWASSEKRQTCLNFVDKLTFGLQGSKLSADFSTARPNDTSGVIEFNGSKEEFSSGLSIECPGLKERVHSSFPDVQSIFDHLELGL